MNELIESIYTRPQDWSDGEFRFKHSSGHDVWIANGLLSCSVINIHTSFISRYRLWKAYKWWCKNKPLDLNSRNQNDNL